MLSRTTPVFSHERCDNCIYYWHGEWEVPGPAFGWFLVARSVPVPGVAGCLPLLLGEALLPLPPAGPPRYSQKVYLIFSRINVKCGYRLECRAQSVGLLVMP